MGAGTQGWGLEQDVTLHAPNTGASSNMVLLNPACQRANGLFCLRS